MDLNVMLILMQVVVLIFSLSLHECAHAYAALRLGDPTAYMLGRVTLNPVKHLDPWGSVVVPLLGLFSGFPLFGWAKPCPVTTRNFKRIKRDDILTTLAGPACNLALAAVSLALLAVLKHLPGMGANAVLTAMAVADKQDVATEGLPPLFPVALVLYYGIVINVLLFVFNLLPMPPLDGSRIIRYVLPYNAAQAMDRMGMFGSLVVFYLGLRFILPVFYWPLLRAFDGLLISM